MTDKLAIFGGEKVCDNLNELRVAWPPILGEEKELLESFLSHRKFTSNDNEELEEIENIFSRYLGTKYFSFLSSGASALHAALCACGIENGDEVIVPSYAFAAPAFAILRVGAIPLFADIRLDTYNTDESSVRQLLTKFKKVKAIIAVHMHGNPCNMIALRKIADEFNVKLIEDVAQSFGAKVNGKYCGTIGHIGCFSFMPSKQLASCGELGGICTNDLNLFNQANSVKTYAHKIIENDSRRYYNSETLGFNYKPSVFNCIFLKCQLDHFEKNISIIKNNASRLTKFIENNVPFLIPPFVEKNAEHVYHFYRILANPSALGLKQTGLFRQCIMEILEKEGLLTRLYQTHPIYKQKIFQKLFLNKFPYSLNTDFIDMYKENYSDACHPNTLYAIDNSFALGKLGAAPYYLSNDKIVDLYIQGFDKLNKNIPDIIKYFSTKGEYENPYSGIPRLSDTQGVFI